MPEDFERDDYDEFQFLEGSARWAGLPWTARPSVIRDQLLVEGRAVSFIRWGAGSPELILLHGGGQNAHTWDTFAMAVHRPAIAIDLPGHGHSDWRDDRNYTPEANAVAVASVIERVAPGARAVVGMSLGGLTALRLSSLRPELVRSVVLVDITPARSQVDGEDPAKGRPMALRLMAGPRRYASWEAMLDAAHAILPHRTRESLIPGLRHNAKRLDDGGWGWRYDRLIPEGAPRPDHSPLWEDVAALKVPAMFVKGARSLVVTDDAVAELRRRLPSVRLEILADAGHAVQSDQPVQLAQLVNDFLR